MWNSTFTNSPSIKFLKQEIDILKGSLGTTPPDCENLKSDVRAITGYSDLDYIGCYQNDYVYRFDVALTTPDNDDTILTPNDITEPAPGRWQKIKSYPLSGHIHSQYAEKPSSYTENNFAGFDTSGSLKDLGTKPDNLINKVPTATEGNFPAFDGQGKLVDSGTKPSDFNSATGVEGKMDKIPGVEAGDVGKIITTDADGNAEMSGKKLVDFTDNLANELRIYPNENKQLAENTWRFRIDGNKLYTERYNGFTWDIISTSEYSTGGPSPWP